MIIFLRFKREKFGIYLNLEGYKVFFKKVL